MPEQVVKSTALILIAIAVLIVILSLMFELFFSIKIGRAICIFCGGILLKLIDYTGIFSVLTQTGINLTCNAFSF